MASCFYKIEACAMVNMKKEDTMLNLKRGIPLLHICRILIYILICIIITNCCKKITEPETHNYTSSLIHITGDQIERFEFEQFVLLLEMIIDETDLEVINKFVHDMSFSSKIFSESMNHFKENYFKVQAGKLHIQNLAVLTAMQVENRDIKFLTEINFSGYILNIGVEWLMLIILPI